MAVQGDVSLMFVIDDTGSMGSVIEAVKKIATALINHPREAPVEYILSPFNDPISGMVFLRYVWFGNKKNYVLREQVHKLRESAAFLRRACVTRRHASSARVKETFLQHVGTVGNALTWRRFNSYRCQVTPFVFTLIVSFANSLDF